MTKFIVRFETEDKGTGWACYDNENEMYADLEVQGITEENSQFTGINYYEVENENIVRAWNFGKPYTGDYWLGCLARAQGVVYPWG